MGAGAGSATGWARSSRRCAGTHARARCAAPRATRSRASRSRRSRCRPRGAYLWIVSAVAATVSVAGIVGAASGVAR
ncbi:hypothetical protein DR62_07400 [Burkholderia thailandensis]|nr:hypothetical protein DR62_07400 [Burkholderia thailandensis]AOI54893.1 hypothetical protein WI24_24125 [Burkholderia thailandensis]AOJ53674.1 hypothetical protein AQ475_22915 [Burkholderia thailandensis]AOJ59819.1 hypothetical protein AQ477_25240 [Burkholderia thailandensis]KXF58938.1 hypothetical protein AQ476_30370 [Burkholderia thailandensis]